MKTKKIKFGLKFGIFIFFLALFTIPSSARIIDDDPPPPPPPGYNLLTSRTRDIFGYVKDTDTLQYRVDLDMKIFDGVNGARDKIEFVFQINFYSTATVTNRVTVDRLYFELENLIGFLYASDSTNHWEIDYINYLSPGLYMFDVLTENSIASWENPSQSVSHRPSMYVQYFGFNCAYDCDGPFWKTDYTHKISFTAHSYNNGLFQNSVDSSNNFVLNARIHWLTLGSHYGAWDDLANQYFDVWGVNNVYNNIVDNSQSKVKRRGDFVWFIAGGKFSNNGITWGNWYSAWVDIPKSNTAYKYSDGYYISDHLKGWEYRNCYHDLPELI